MTIELTAYEKLHIIESKIRFANEQIYNYDVELAMGAAETEPVEGQRRYVDIDKFRTNALAHLEVLTTLHSELMTLINQQTEGQS
jgi:hypothetical protein